MASLQLNLAEEAMQGVIEAMEKTGAEIANRIRADLSVACDGTNHSPVGSPPYRESGALWDSIDYEVRTEGNCVVLTISAGPVYAEDGTDYAPILEYGLPPMTGPRPFMAPYAEQAYELFLDYYTRPID